VNERPEILGTRGLVKRYGKVEALVGLDLRVREGEVYGFLGRNGAGKSTAIRVMMGITRANAGTVRLFGEACGRDPVALRRRVGYVAQEQNFYGWMTPHGLGRFLRGLFPGWEDAEYARLLGALELPPRRKIRTFSGGMKAKLALAAALAHRPPLLILDEPTAGLDPVARREFLDLVRDQAGRGGRTTFFSSHLVDEVEAAAGRVGIIDQGRMLFEGGLDELAGRVRVLRYAPARGEVDRDTLPLPGILSRQAEDQPAQPPIRVQGAGLNVLRDRVQGAGLTVLRDGVERGARQLVVQAARPADLRRLEPLPPGWQLQRLPLEEIFIALVTRAGGGSGP
jgi:ABC-2 type transport system ATP-binding protein